MGEMDDRANADAAGVVIPRPLLVLGVLIVIGLQIFLGGSFLPDGWTWFQYAVGIPLIVLGAGLVAWTARTMLGARTTPDPTRADSTLLTTGPFRISRNPFYLGTIVAFLGIAVAFDGAWLLLAPLWLAVMANLQAAREERYLDRRFGQPYAEYRQRVRRWL